MNALEGLFKLDREPAAGSASSEVRVNLNAEHPIFEGHFPDQPVLPGVCMVQIALTIASKMHGKPLAISEARMIKFLAPVDPRKTSELVYTTTLTPTETGVKTDVQAKTGETIVLKLSAEMTPE